MKRVISLILTIAMIASMCTGLVVNAYAAETDVAQIGNFKYTSLDAAFDAAVAGDTIEVLTKTNEKIDLTLLSKNKTLIYFFNPEYKAGAEENAVLCASNSNVVFVSDTTNKFENTYSYECELRTYNSEGTAAQKLSATKTIFYGDMETLALIYAQDNKNYSTTPKIAGNGSQKTDGLIDLITNNIKDGTRNYSIIMPNRNALNGQDTLVVEKDMILSTYSGTGGRIDFRLMGADSFAFDLNGHEIYQVSGDNGNGIAVTSDGSAALRLSKFTNMTIIDSVGNGSVVGSQAVVDYYGDYSSGDGGILTLESGKLIGRMVPALSGGNDDNKTTSYQDNNEKGSVIRMDDTTCTFIMNGGELDIDRHEYRREGETKLWKTAAAIQVTQECTSSTIQLNGGKIEKIPLDQQAPTNKLNNEYSQIIYIDGKSIEVDNVYITVSDKVQLYPTDVAQIGDVKYTSLKDAIAAANTLGTATIQMIQDTEFTFDEETYAEVSATSKIILDLNGKVIKSTGTRGSTSQLIDNRGTLTITDSAEKVDGHFTGKIIHGANPAWVYDGSGSYNGSYASNLIRNYGGTLTIDGGYLENASIAGQSGGAAYVVDNNNNEATGTTSLVINDGELVAAWTAIRQFVQRTDKENNIIVNGGSVSAKRNCFMLNASALNLAKLTINDGTFTVNKDGDSGTAAVIQLWQANTSDTNMSIEVKGGYLSAKGGATAKIVELDFVKAEEGKAKEAIKISGGFFNINDESLNDYVIDGCGTVEVNPTDAGYIEGYPYAVVAKSPVAQIGDKNYTTLQGAVDAAKDNDIVKVLIDIDYGYITAPIIKNGETQDHNVKNGKKLTLDLNGKTITAKFNAEWPDGNKCVIQNGFDGDLTITGNGKIKIEESNQERWNKSCSIFKNSGRLTIKNGTFENNGQSDMSYVIDNQACYNNEHAYVVIDDGTFKCPVYTVVRLYPNAPDSQLASTDCAVTINGGTFSGKRCFYIHHHSKDMKDDCKVTINGGSFEATNRIFQFETSGLSKDIVKINISGGEFKTTASEDGAIFHVDSILAESYINGCINVVISEAEGKTTKIDAENNPIFEQQTGKESAMTGEVSGGLFSTKTNVENYLDDFYTLKETSTDKQMWEVVLKEKVKEINVKDEVAQRGNEYIEKSSIPNEITKEKDKILKENNITYDSVTDIISNTDKEVKKDTAKVIIKSYYVVTETATDTDIPVSATNRVKYDITPKYDIEVVASAVSSTDVSETNLVVIKQIVTDADYKVGEPTEVTVKMPNNFFTTDKDRVKVIHHIGDNETEELPATVDYTNKTVTFVTNSFSVFEFIAEAPQTLIVYNNQGGTGTQNEITATNGQAMPFVTRPTRDGWTFAGYFDEIVGGKQYYKADGTSACSWDKSDEKTVLYAQWTSTETKLDNMSIEIDGQFIYVNYIVNLNETLSKTDVTLSDTDAKTSKTNNKLVIKKAFSPEKLHDGYEIILNNGEFRTSTNIETYVSESELKDSLLDAFYVLEKCAYYEVNTDTNNKISSNVIAYLAKAEKYSNTNIESNPSATGSQLAYLDMWLDNGSFRMYVYIKANNSLDNLNWSCNNISDTDIEYSTGTNDGFYLLTFPVEYNNLECTYNFSAGNGVSISISPMHYIKNVLFEQRFDGVDAYNNSEVKEYKLGQRDTTLALWNLYNKLKVVG